MAKTVLLRGGLVCDPSTRSEAVADILVDGGVITSVGPDIAAPEASVVDVSGLVVGPGFVDLHSHVHSVAGQWLQALDGVTTALELEAGLTPIARAYDEAAQAGRPLNYGFSASWASARGQALLGLEPDASLLTTLKLVSNPEWQRSSSPREQAEWLMTLEAEIADGALGIGVLMGYAPRTEPAEFLALARLAATAGVPAYTHVRELAEVDPTTPIDGPEELTIAAAETGAAMHHCHVNSSSGQHVDRVLDLIDKAQTNGARVTVEAYPYGAGATAVGAYFLDPERLVLKGRQPSDLVLVATGERIADADRLREVRRTDPGAECFVEFLDERREGQLALLRRPFEFADSIVASDAMPLIWPDGSRDTNDWPLPTGGKTHPRTAGTFTKTLRMMVRESATWSWLEAFRRCSYLPARVIEAAAPTARRKGHLGIGADADIAVLDPHTVTDTATYLDPTRSANGVVHLLVNGTFVVRDGDLLPDARPGRPVRGELS
ncbi:MAG TPA: amidohydrolase family protein [Nocardioidaceae bacterium]|nr:amidohydrolase family protein [Nocardioidaceae bacterium]